MTDRIGSLYLKHDQRIRRRNRLVAGTIFVLCFAWPIAAYLWIA